MKIVFFGTPEFAAYSLQQILDKTDHQVAAVVTMPDKPAGRGHKLFQSPVKKLAVERGIPVLQPEKLKNPLFLEELAAIGAEMFVVIAFRMLPEAVWAMPPKGTFNLHASLLPRYRGAAPINRAVMNGDTVTGVTTFFLGKDIDTGDIIDQVEMPIHPEDNAGSVHDRLMQLGAELTIKTLNAAEKGAVETRSQADCGIEPTDAPKIFAETCLIDFNQPVVKVHNHVRGLSPYPGAKATVCTRENIPLEFKVFTTRYHEGGNTVPGTVTVDNERLYIDCADGRIEVLELQPSGKRRMPTADYLRGARLVR